jgi:hypothetical protein
VVERHVANVNVEGSNPFSRSNFPFPMHMRAFRILTLALTGEPVMFCRANVEMTPWY